MSTSTRSRHRRRASARNGYRDKFQLYQTSVQNVEFEVQFMQRVYRRARDKAPLKLREDFCGTSLLSCEWVKRVAGGVAVGLDLDGPTLDYARRVNVEALGKLADRVELRRENVLEANGGRPDIVAAYNFSYFIFKKRAELLAYFKRAHKTLARDGLLMLDIYGGPDAQIVQEETTEHDGFDYVWDQIRYNPITGELYCAIHFDFPDGTRMKRAFTYDWRLWTIPEVRELLEEAGFESSEVYWEGTDHEDGSGNGVFRLSTKGDDASCWIAYIAARK